MLPERDLGYLDDIRDYADRALQYTSGMTYEQFVVSGITTDAVLRCLMVIGEAAGRLSPAVHAALPQFDWNGMKAMRHVVAHDYHRVDFATIWNVVADELPRLHGELSAYLEELQ